MAKTIAQMTDEELANDVRLNIGVTFERFSRHLLSPYGDGPQSEYTDALEPLVDAVTLQDWLDDELDRLINDAREAGASWQKIGDSLGMTRQAAWERFAE